MKSRGGEVRNWYIRLRANFFTDREIIYIESLYEEKYGRHFPSFVIHLYLKMLCYSIEDNGHIVFEHREGENNDLAGQIARRFFSIEEKDCTVRALSILESLGLIETEDDEKVFRIFIPAVVNNTGSHRLSSEKRRQRRILAKSGKRNLNTVEDRGEMTGYSARGNVFLFQEQYEQLAKMQGFYGVMELYSEEKCLKKEKGRPVSDESDYEQLLHRLHGSERGEGSE